MEAADLGLGNNATKARDRAADRQLSEVKRAKKVVASA